MFLLLRFDQQASWSGKMVIHAGGVVQQTFDGDQQSQALDWALLDIFAPFWAEWCDGREFGSLWQKWVEDIAAAVEGLRKGPDEHLAAAPVRSSQPTRVSASSAVDAAALLNSES